MFKRLWTALALVAGKNLMRLHLGRDYLRTFSRCREIVRTTYTRASIGDVIGLHFTEVE